MCNHNVNSNEFKYCPYCGEPLTQTSRQDNYPCYAAYSWGQLDPHRTSFEEFDLYDASDYIAKHCKKRLEFLRNYVEPMKRIVKTFNEDDTFTSVQTTEYQGTTIRLFNAGLLGIVGKTKTRINLYDDIYKEVEINQYCINPEWKKILTHALEYLQSAQHNKRINILNELQQVEKQIEYYESIQF